MKFSKAAATFALMKIEEIEAKILGMRAKNAKMDGELANVKPKWFHIFGPPSTNFGGCFYAEYNWDSDFKKTDEILAHYVNARNLLAYGCPIEANYFSEHFRTKFLQYTFDNNIVEDK